MNIEQGITSVPLKKTEEKKPQTTLGEGDKSFKEEFADLEKEALPKPVNAKQVDDVQEVDDNKALELKNQVAQLSSVINQMNNPLHQTDEISDETLKVVPTISDNQNRKGDFKENIQNVLNNDFGVNKAQEKLPELKADISFSQQGENAFSSYLPKKDGLVESVEERNEDDNVLSSMAENLAMVNKVATSMAQVDEVGVVVDRVVNAHELNLTRADVQMFINLVHEKLDISELKAEQTSKSQPVSEILANMLAESVRNNKAFRLNFDNDISVIIRVSREGRISANFMPGSDVAENYLRNNMANLVQRFEEENIPYDDLSHQKQKRENEQQNKKDKKDE